MFVAADCKPAGSDVILPGGQAATPSFLRDPTISGGEAGHRGAIGGTGMSRVLSYWYILYNCQEIISLILTEKWRLFCKLRSVY